MSTFSSSCSTCSIAPSVMRSTSLLCALVAALTSVHSADLPNAGGWAGGEAPGPVYTLEGSAALADAGRHPDATHDVTFHHRAFDDTQQAFTWRVNVTNVAISEPLEDLGKPDADYSDGFYINNIQWQLEWPKRKDGSDQSLQSFLTEVDMAFYYSAYIANLPASTMNRWTNPSDGDCTSILGEACVRDIHARNSTSGLWPNYRACKEALTGSTANTVYGFGPMNNTAGEPFTTGETIFYLASKAFYKGDSTKFNLAISALQIMKLDFKPSSVDKPDAHWTSSVICQVVAKPREPSARSLALTIVGIVLFILLLVGGSVFFWHRRKSQARVRLT